ncbi:hypothetical protein QSJ19_21045 [Gordonia sp. ABSL11-1]|uniref:hypothetical protein n=1 Tax=Gordonia sp. ABSL11-1 TaxID=3053924 RepID=UPI002572C5C2|nr:hypothetical protein [Gordonia sp. ABSL11-1]MDL9948023.1 hypothetical protein [Gordonia sp. ABSL11-1]
MLLPARIAQGVADGTVDLAFRRWKAVRVTVGSTFISSAGVVEIVSVEQIDPTDISDDDARRAGFDSAEQAVTRLRAPDGRSTSTRPAADGADPSFRVGLRYAGPDPRIALRADDELSDDDVADLRLRLARLDDRSSHGPWTRSVLDVIARRPAVASTELAAELGRGRPDFKLDVRKLKKLGLTRSLEVGYELSPRGRALLAKLDEPGADGA